MPEIIVTDGLSRYIPYNSWPYCNCDGGGGGIENVFIEQHLNVTTGSTFFEVTSNGGILPTSDDLIQLDSSGGVFFLGLPNTSSNGFQVNRAVTPNRIEFTRTGGLIVTTNFRLTFFIPTT